MVAPVSLERLKPHLVPAIAALVGLGVAVGIATAPGDTLNGVLDRAGVAALIPAAAPPIGVTGRTVLALVAGALIALLGVVGRWCSLLPARRARAGDVIVPSAPVVRRADAHPDAPPRRPIRASEDLGAPLPIAAEAIPAAQPEPGAPPVERPLPTDLDQVMSAFDPAALLREPLPAPDPVPPLARPAPPLAQPVPWLQPKVAEPEVMEVAAARPAPVAVPQPRAVEEQPLPMRHLSETAPRPIDPPVSAVPAQEAAPIRSAAPLTVVPPAMPRPLATPPVAAREPKLAVAPAPVDTPDPADQSIDALLARLEAVAARRSATVAPATPPDPEPNRADNLHETLQSLRRLASH